MLLCFVSFVQVVTFQLSNIYFFHKKYQNKLHIGQNNFPSFPIEHHIVRRKVSGPCHLNVMFMVWIQKLLCILYGKPDNVSLDDLEDVMRLKPFVSTSSGMNINQHNTLLQDLALTQV